MRAGFAAFSLLLLLAPLQSVLAARGAIVDVDTVEVREGPGSSFGTVEQLSKGDPVTASNQSTEGYYKVRTASGAIGFIQADTLVLQPLPDAEDTSIADPAPNGAEPQASKSTREEPPVARIKVLGGYNFFAVTDLNEFLGADVIKNGYSAGLEVEYLFTPAIAGMLRAEYLFKNVAARDRVSNKSYDMGVSSIPIVAGINITLGAGSRWSTHLAVLGGVAPATLLSATSTSEAAPNVTASSAIGYTGMGKLDVVYSFDRVFTAFAEGGYRYLSTSQLTPGLAGNGSSIFQSGGIDVPMSINLSGPFVGLGAGIAF